MATVSILNTDAQLSGLLLINAEDAQTITGLKTFDRDPNAPFAVSAGSAMVTNLDADKIDGVEGSSLVRADSQSTMTAHLTWNDNIHARFGTAADALLYYDGTDLILDTQNAGTGVLSLSAGQLGFPATQNASSGANVLDDYEEGSWTPVLGGAGGTSGQTYSLQGGTYVKIGTLVIAHAFITLTDKGTITGNLEIQGLPFTAQNVNSAGVVAWQYFTAMGSNVNVIAGFVEPNATTARVYLSATPGTGLTQGTTSDVGNSTSMAFTVTYTAAA